MAQLLSRAAARHLRPGARARRFAAPALAALVAGCSLVSSVGDFDDNLGAGGSGPGPGGCQTCASAQAECGALDNGCGQTLDCGDCSARPGTTCAGLGTANKCECRPRTCADVGGCGSLDDGCGGQLDCGCGEAAACEAGQCVACFTQVRAGGAFTCALRGSDGTVWCWGRNDVGQLGDGTKSGLSCAAAGGVPCRSTPAPVVDLSDVVDLAVGSDHACARRRDGTVWCWGSDRFGQLGTGRSLTLPDEASLERPSLVQGLGAATALAAGAGHTCAIAGGALYCWGDNGGGQLGLGGDTTLALASSPQEVDFAGARDVSAGQLITCASDANAKAFCWGNNDKGQLGAGLADAFRNIPTAVAAPSGGPPFAVSALRPGRDHGCAATTTGDALCWGANDVGQLGNPAIAGRSNVPAPVLLGSGMPLGNIAEVGVGAQHTCARARDGVVFCWGQGADGQLGHSPGGVGTDAIPQAVDGLGAASTLSVGARHACVLNANGETLCWGSNKEAAVGSPQLGVALTTPSRVALRCQ